MHSLWFYFGKMLNLVWWKSRQRWLVDLVWNCFVILLLVYIILLLIDIISDGNVSRHFKLEYLLIAVISSGLLVNIATRKADVEYDGGSLGRGVFVAFVGGVVCAVAVWYELRSIGWFSYVVAAVGFLTLGGLYRVIMIRNGDEKEGD